MANRLESAIMDTDTFLRVKLTFGAKCKLAKLDRTRDTSLSSMMNLRKFIYKHFPEIEEMVENSPTTIMGSSGPSHRLIVKGKDNVGDYITLENEDDLDAMELWQYSNVEFDVEIVPAAHTASVGSGAFHSKAPLGIRKSMNQCRYFQSGFCRYGDSCRFAHDPSKLADSAAVGAQQPARASTSSEGRWPRAGHPNQFSMKRDWSRSLEHGDDWLKNQATTDSVTYIEYLSGGKGSLMLSRLVNQRNLPDDTIALIVKLLAREEIRTSLLRRKTNKIYGALTGSPFLLQLKDHIASHLGMLPNLKPQDVLPYLALTEELQSRTMEGWKEVPLHELSAVVLKLEDSTAKDDLVATVTRLTDHSERVQRLMAVAPAQQQDLQGGEFREMSIVPGTEELLEGHAKQKLPVNLIGVQYLRVNDYLNTHFRLLREDCIDPLRQGIKAYRSSWNNATGNGAQTSQNKTILDLRVYTEVQLAGIRCGDQGVEFIVSFHLAARGKNPENWESSKKLMFGALLCISSDQFQTFFWGVVARRDVMDLVRGRVGIRIIQGSDDNFTGSLLQKGFVSSEVFVMVESTASYFEAYHHVLKTLQRQEMENIPFTPYLLHLVPWVSPPSYLQRRKSGDEYDFSRAFPAIYEELGKRSIRITQSEWPSGWADSLDRAQQDALKHALTKELAIIQGPPGTGKTFLGLILVKILLANLKRGQGQDILEAWQTRGEPDEDAHDVSGPILVICFTNHALDQFLEGIFRDGERNLIRIGGRGRSAMLNDNNLQNLLLKQRMTRNGVNRTHRSLFGSASIIKDSLESQMHRCIDAMGVNRISKDMLARIASEDQWQSLFWTGHDQRHRRSYNQTLRLWLTEADPNLARHFVTPDREPSSDSEDTAQRRRNADKRWRGTVKLLQYLETDAEREWVPVWRRGRPGRRQGAGHQRAHAQPAEKVGLIEPDENPDDGIHARRLDIADGGQPIEGADHNPPQNVADFADRAPIDEAIRLAPDLWELTLPQRTTLHEHWLEEKNVLQAKHLRMLSEQYEEACKGVKEVENEIQLSMLRKARVVGMTTTAAAKHHDLLKSLKPEIVIVEEAAEVLEGHVLACISPSVQHLILIGDHLQLRPSVAVHELAVKNKLDVSMFERLVRSGVEHVTLQEQRRMRPNISKLVRSLYPESRDHESVSRYEDVSGMKSNVFFFDHKAEEDNSPDGGSKFNTTEAKLVVELCLYQGSYKAENIAILSMYTGQLQEIKRLLHPRIHSRFTVRAIGEPLSRDQEADSERSINLLPRVSSVDDYQGEESDIIILSLVRSNSTVSNSGVGTIGFLNISNRICVALTRARKGLFIFGNAALLAEKSTLWNDVTTSMRESGELGSELELYCQNHPEIITRIRTAEDFKQVEDGGCSLPCDFQLDCGHACPRRCHPSSHDRVLCPKRCLRQHDLCCHSCNVRCHGRADCPPCKVLVTKKLLHCAHEQRMECSSDLTEEVCRSACQQNLPCGHQCKSLCTRPCTICCDEKIAKLLPCGHLARVACHQDPTTFSCKAPCQALVSDCQHQCQGSCGSCKQGQAHIECQQTCGRTLPCGHSCEAQCSLSCPPCRKKCQKRCFHSKCSESCGNLCKPCREPCSWQCEHHRCEKRCHEICTRPRCDLPCPKLIPKCGHRCSGLCGEPCPKKCRICHPQTMDSITRMTLEEYEDSDTFVELTDCGHIFEVSGLDTWMDSSEATQADGSVAIKLKACPECRTLVWRTHRYCNVVKEKHSQVEAVKEKMLGYDLAKKAHRLLERGDHNGALQSYHQALQQNPGLMEAQLGIGHAFFGLGEYDKAIMHLSLLVKQSSFASSLAKHIESALRSRLGSDSTVLEKHYQRSLRRPSDSIAIQAVVQWASALAQQKDFTNAIELCHAVLKRAPENLLATEIRDKAERGEEVQLVVQAMQADIGGRGHWYTCPNGHYYTIGECGGAMELSKCPDCKADVGGGQHKLTARNSHSTIDGSHRAAWPGN